MPSKPVPNAIFVGHAPPAAESRSSVQQIADVLASSAAAAAADAAADVAADTMAQTSTIRMAMSPGAAFGLGFFALLGAAVAALAIWLLVMAAGILLIGHGIR
jgi:hypothetical protein